MEKSITKSIKDLNILIGKNAIDEINPIEYLNHTQIQILVYLIKHRNKEICQKDLQKETHLKKASITGTLDALEDKGAIIRIPSEDDKRKNIIVLSEKALKAKNKIEKKYEEIENRIKIGIKEKDLEIFFNVIGKMERNLK